MRIILLVGVNVVLLFVIAFSKNTNVPAPDRLAADRMEQFNAIPAEMRNELTRLIERTSPDVNVTAAEHNAVPPTRIERAMQFKPAERFPK